MIHDFDCARWVAGDVARGNQGAGGPVRYIQAIIRFKSGALGLVEGEGGHTHQGYTVPQSIFQGPAA